MEDKNLELVFRNLKLSPIQFENWFKQICLGNNIKIELIESKNNGKEIHYRVSNSLIRIYNTKKGLTVDLSVCNDGSIRQIISNELEKMVNSNIELVKDKSYTYKNRTTDEIDNVKRNLESCFKRDEYNFNVSSQNSSRELITIIDKKSREKVVVNIFNTGTIMIQGLCYILWQDITKVIEESLYNFSVNETINRILFKEEEKEDVDFKEYEKELALLLREKTFNYLEKIDRTYLTSCCYIIKSKIKLPEYSPILMPLFKAFEGYFRKLIRDLDFYNEAKTDKYWRIGNIFDRNKEIMKEKYRDEINNTTIINELERLFTLMKKRDDICHSGIPTYIYVDRFEDAQKYYDDVLNAICSSYNVLEKFIK